MEKGDIVYVEYDAYADEMLFDTTHEDLAHEKEIHDEKQPYKPIPVIIGSGRLVKGFENALSESQVGEEKETEFGDDEGFGKRDTKLVETFSIREFRKNKIDPQVGMEVSLRNRKGTVITVTAGRVIVDFNDSLAGKKLRYRFRIVEKIEDPEGKANAIIAMYYKSYEGFRTSMNEGFLDIVLPEISKSDQRWFLVKFGVVADLGEYAHLSNVRFIEEYTKGENSENEPTEKSEITVEPENAPEEGKKEPEEIPAVEEKFTEPKEEVENPSDQMNKE